jgi:hypothetical protein
LTSILKIVLWIFQKMCISEFDIFIICLFLFIYMKFF